MDIELNEIRETVSKACDVAKTKTYRERLEETLKTSIEAEANKGEHNLTLQHFRIATCPLDLIERLNIVHEVLTELRKKGFFITIFSTNSVYYIDINIGW